MSMHSVSPKTKLCFFKGLLIGSSEQKQLPLSPSTGDLLVKSLPCSERKKSNLVELRGIPWVYYGRDIGKNASAHLLGRQGGN
jgi:hypothetical protein